MDGPTDECTDNVQKQTIYTEFSLNRYGHMKAHGTSPNSYANLYSYAKFLFLNLSLRLNGGENPKLEVKYRKYWFMKEFLRINIKVIFYFHISDCIS